MDKHTLNTIYIPGAQLFWNRRLVFDRKEFEQKLACHADGRWRGQNRILWSQNAIWEKKNVSNLLRQVKSKTFKLSQQISIFIFSFLRNNNYVLRLYFWYVIQWINVIISHLFSIVHFSLSGLNEAGVWSYSAKVYPDSSSAPKTLVDVTAASSEYK